MTIIEKTDNRVGEDVEKLTSGEHTAGGVWNGKAVWQFLKSLSIYLLEVPNISPRKVKVYLYTCIFYMNILSNLFVIAKNWKQTKYSSPGEWLTSVWCIPIMEHYSVIKKNKYWFTKQCGWISDPLSQVEESRQIRLHTAWF